MERMPPGPPRSIRAWGWVLLVFGLLNLITFSFTTMSALASSDGAGFSGVSAIAFVAMAFVAMVASGIGFINGWRVSWFLGLMLGVAWVTYGGWILLDIRRNGADVTYLVLSQAQILFTIAPGLLLLVCLFMPSTLRWMRFKEPEDLATPLLSAEPSEPARRGRLLPTVIVLSAVVVLVAWFWFGRGDPSFPEEAAGFQLVQTRTVRSVLGFGPPVSNVGHSPVVKERLAQYTDGAGSFEVRLIEHDLTDFSHRELLKAAGIGVVASPEAPEGRLGATTSETIEASPTPASERGWHRGASGHPSRWWGGRSGTGRPRSTAYGASPELSTTPFREITVARPDVLPSFGSLRRLRIRATGPRPTHRWQARRPLSSTAPSVATNRHP